MPITIPETVKVKFLAQASGSATRNNADITLMYEAWDTNRSRTLVTESHIETLLSELSEAVDLRSPPLFLGLGKQKVTFREEDMSRNRFFFDVAYSYPPESVRRWSFDTTGGQVLVRHSRGTQRFGTGAPDCKSAIGVKPDGSVEGADIVIPALRLTCTFKHPRNSPLVNVGTWQTYVKTLARMTGTTNSTLFGEYEPGELLFLGATGELVPNIPTDIQYHFAASENVTGLNIGGILNVAKKGHEYLWVMFQAAEDQNKLIQQPMACYVERVYGESNFSGLGI